MWKDLDALQKAEVIKMAVSNGIKDLKSIRSFYDSTSSHSFGKGGTLTKGQKNTSQYIINYFKNKGLTTAQAQGLTARLGVESSLDARAINPTSKALGLAQWLGPRKKAYLAKYGKDPYNIDNQLDFIWHELNTTHKKGLQEIKKSKTAQEAALNAFGWFEFSVGPQKAIEEMNKHNQSGKKSYNDTVNWASKISGVPADPYPSDYNDTTPFYTRERTYNSNSSNTESDYSQESEDSYTEYVKQLLDSVPESPNINNLEKESYQKNLSSPQINKEKDLSEKENSEYTPIQNLEVEEKAQQEQLNREAISSLFQNKIDDEDLNYLLREDEEEDIEEGEGSTYPLSDTNSADLFETPYSDSMVQQIKQPIASNYYSNNTYAEGGELSNLDMPEYPVDTFEYPEILDTENNLEAEKSRDYDAEVATLWRTTKLPSINARLRKAGVSRNVRAALMANIIQESTVNENASNGTHFGYIQNEKGIVDYIKRNYGGYKDEHQINFLIDGLTGNLKDTKSKWGKELNKRFKGFNSAVKANPNLQPHHISPLWEQNYERSGGQGNTHRIKFAKALIKYMNENHIAYASPEEYNNIVPLLQQAYAIQQPSYAAFGGHLHALGDSLGIDDDIDPVLELSEFPEIENKGNGVFGIPGDMLLPLGNGRVRILGANATGQILDGDGNPIHVSEVPTIKPTEYQLQRRKAAAEGDEQAQKEIQRDVAAEDAAMRMGVPFGDPRSYHPANIGEKPLEIVSPEFYAILAASAPGIGTLKGTYETGKRVVPEIMKAMMPSTYIDPIATRLGASVIANPMTGEGLAGLGASTIPGAISEAGILSMFGAEALDELKNDPNIYTGANAALMAGLPMLGVSAEAAGKIMPYYRRGQRFLRRLGIYNNRDYENIFNPQKARTAIANAIGTKYSDVGLFNEHESTIEKLNTFLYNLANSINDNEIVLSGDNLKSGAWTYSEHFKKLNKKVQDYLEYFGEFRKNNNISYKVPATYEIKRAIMAEDLAEINRLEGDLLKTAKNLKDSEGEKQLKEFFSIVKNNLGSKESKMDMFTSTSDFLQGIEGNMYKKGSRFNFARRKFIDDFRNKTAIDFSDDISTINSQLKAAGLSGEFVKNSAGNIEFVIKGLSKLPGRVPILGTKSEVQGEVISRSAPAKINFLGSVSSTSTKEFSRFFGSGKFIQSANVDSHDLTKYLTSSMSDEDAIRAAINHNINYLQTNIPGFKPFGSSVEVARLGRNKFPGDYDGFMSRADAELFIHNSKGNPDIQISSKPGGYKVKYEGADVEIDVVDVDQATGKGNKYAEELFKYYFPDEYQKATLDLMTTPGKNFSSIDPDNYIKINKSAEELLAAMNSEEVSIINAIATAYNRSSKQKNITKIDDILKNSDSKIVASAIRRYADSMLGGRNKARLLPKLTFKTKEENIKLLKDLGIKGSLQKIAEDPEKMQNAMNLWYLHGGATYYRNIDPGAYDARKLASTTEQILTNNSDWFTEGSILAGTANSRGGSASGLGLNTTIGGQPGAQRVLFTVIQPEVKGLYEGMDAQEAINKVKHSMGFNINKDEAKALNNILKQYGITSVPEVAMSGNKVLTALPEKGEEIKKAMQEFSDMFGINSIVGSRYGYHGLDPYYAGMTRRLIYPSGRDIMGIQFNSAGERYTDNIGIPLDRYGDYLVDAITGRSDVNDFMNHVIRIDRSSKIKATQDARELYKKLETFAKKVDDVQGLRVHSFNAIDPQYAFEYNLDIAGYLPNHLSEGILGTLKDWQEKAQRAKRMTLFNKKALGGPLNLLNYDQWKDAIKSYKGINIDNDQTYDYYKFYHENPLEALAILNDSPDAHFTDKYKTVWHPTFSNESVYSGNYDLIHNPFGFTGGSWGTKNGVDYYKEPPASIVSSEDRMRYIADAEDGNLNLLNNAGELIAMLRQLPTATVTGKKKNNGKK